MARPPLLTLSDVCLTFGGNPLFEGVSLALAKGERAALVGRNGAGKSTLMKIITGEIEPDMGAVWRQPGTSFAKLDQEPDLGTYASALDYAAEETPDRHRAEAELMALGIDPVSDPKILSGGQQRRVALARAFAADPDVLLLDEPTNHLDVPMIETLEKRLLAFNGVVLVVSHDRRFLENISTHTLWLRQRKVLKSPKGYAHFDDWAEQIETEEFRALRKMNTQMKDEKRWLARGVTGRRKRNVGRLARLKEMRVQQSQMRSALNDRGARVDLNAATNGAASRKVIEARGLTKSYGDVCLVSALDLKIIRGDRIGIIGPNGAGKTTLVKLLLGEIAPDSGSVKHAQTLKGGYFDQTRASLNDKDTLWENMAPQGGDSIMVQDRSRHIAAYAKDFLFQPEQLRQPVHALSGGERNRLGLAIGLAQPSNLLVLDEPTNDLDMQTLDMLEDMLLNYEGTLLLVSHDRAFLDATVTSCLCPVGDGQWIQVPGGWSDAVIQLGHLMGAEDEPVKIRKTKPKATSKQSTEKLSFKDEHRLKELDQKIPELAAQIAALEARLADPDFFTRDAKAFEAASAALIEARQSLEASEEEWLEIEAKREALG